MTIYNQSGFYQVADGSNEYRSYSNELAQMIDESEKNYPDYIIIDHYFQNYFVIGKYGIYFDNYDGNF